MGGIGSVVQGAAILGRLKAGSSNPSFYAGQTLSPIRSLSNPNLARNPLQVLHIVVNCNDKNMLSTLLGNQHIMEHKVFGMQ